MRSTVVQARQSRGFVPPRFSVLTYWVSQVVGGVYMRRVQNVESVRVEGMKALWKAMRDFQKGKSKLLIVFRHVAVSDGPLIVQVVSQLLRRWCREKGKTLTGPPHTHFLYGRGVLNWAGGLARWAFPRMGGVPVFNERVDRESQRTIRRLLTSGRFPLAFAPEAQVTYHQDRVFPLSAGTGMFPLWALEDLERTGVDMPVVILPIAIGYGYDGREPELLRAAVGRIALETGDAGVAENTADLRPAMSAALRHIERSIGLAAGTAAELGEFQLQERIDSLCEKAISLGESAAGLIPEGDRLSRIFRLRYWIMNSQFREDVNLDGLTASERDAADERAQLAAKIQPYERVADLLHYLKTDGIADTPTGNITRKLECALNLLDALQRMRGGDINERYEPDNKSAFVFIGKRIDVSMLIGDIFSRRERRERIRAAVAEALTDAVRGLGTMKHQP